MSEDHLLRFREEFPSLEKSVYLVSHSMGAMPRGTRDAFAELCDHWVDRAADAYDDAWLPMLAEHADRIGRILGAPPGSVTLGTNVSLLQAVVASSLEYRPDRNRIVYSDMQFPSVSYVWKAEERRGAEVVIVPSRDRVGVPLEELLAAIDERTLLVPISHVLFRSGYLKDAQAVARRAHEVGAWVLLDAYQSVGTVPVDVAALDVDFLCGGSHKWLCGGAGCAYLYTRPALLGRLEPRVTGWFGHAEPFAFRMPAQEYASGARRLMGGTWAVPSVYQARAGAELVLAAGAEEIRRKSLRQTQRLVERALDDGYRLTSPRDPERRGGMVCFDLPGAERAQQALAARRFRCDHRPGTGLRVSPHFYTRDDELDAFMDELARIAPTVRA